MHQHAGDRRVVARRANSLTAAGSGRPAGASPRWPDPRGSSVTDAALSTPIEGEAVPRRSVRPCWEALMVQRRLDPVEQHRGELRAVRGGHESAAAPRLPQARRRAEGSEGRPDDGVVAYDVAEVLRRLGVTRPTIYRFLNSAN